MYKGYMGGYGRFSDILCYIRDVWRGSCNEIVD